MSLSFGQEAGLSGISSIADYVGSSLLQNSANAKNKRSMWTQLWMQKWLMDQQNEYNKPINQMKRLAEAGLNPNLVYENGGTTVAAASGSAPSYSRASSSRMSLDFLSKMSMIKSMQEQEAKIDNTRAATNSINANLDIKRAELDMAREFNAARIRAVNAGINSTVSTTRAKDLDAEEKRTRSMIWQAIGNILTGDPNVKQLW